METPEAQRQFAEFYAALEAKGSHKDLRKSAEISRSVMGTFDIIDAGAVLAACTLPWDARGVLLANFDRPGLPEEDYIVCAMHAILHNDPDVAPADAADFFAAFVDISDKPWNYLLTPLLDTSIWNRESALQPWHLLSGISAL